MKKASQRARCEAMLQTNPTEHSLRTRPHMGRHYRRCAVIFSKFDISCALEKHEAVECRGYTREDAARIGLNVLMYSINQ